MCVKERGRASPTHIPPPHPPKCASEVGIQSAWFEGHWQQKINTFYIKVFD